jgi:hypothetical protein
MISKVDELYDLMNKLSWALIDDDHEQIEILKKQIKAKEIEIANHDGLPSAF